MWDAVRGNAPDSDSERRKNPLRDLGTELLEQMDESEGTWESQDDVECEKAKQNDIGRYGIQKRGID